MIKALVEAGMLLARGRFKHQYPHSWRSKKPVIFRNTPQWFIAMDKDIADNGNAKPGDTLRARALRAISVTQWVPPSGQNRITGMINEQARLGDLAPARLGRADRGVRAREGRRLGRDPAGRRRQQAHCRRLRAGRRRRLVHGRRPRTLSRLPRQRGLEEGRRHLRRLVRFRLDACLRAGRPPCTFRASPASSARSMAATIP